MEHIKKSKNISKSEVNSGKELLESTYGKIGMFAKLIQNHEVFHIKLEKFLKKEQPNYDVDSTKEASSYTVYNRAWGCIKDLDLDCDEVKEIISNFNYVFLRNILNKVILYYEMEDEPESYKKCAFLLKIKNISKDYLES